MMTDYTEPPENERSKEHGSTTLKQCGWCTHASGSHRYSYYIEGSCRLQKSYSSKVHWDDDCYFLTASKIDIESFIDSHKHSITSAEQSISNHQKYIEELRELCVDAPERPPLPSDRKHDHFNIDDPIAQFHDGKWYFGEVKMGYRHHDGCVSYRLDGLGPQGGNDSDFPYKDGFWGVGCSVPIVMLKSEYDFFKDNPEEYLIWCEKAYAKSFNGTTLKPALIL